MDARRSALVRSPAPGLAVWFIVALSTRAGAQSAPKGAVAPLCCDSGSGTCAAPKAPTAPPKLDSLGVPTQCPLPSGGVATGSADAGAPAVEIEVPGAGGTNGATLVVDTQEPLHGFTGACLAQAVSYVPTLPTVCYRVKQAGTSAGFGTHSLTVVTAPAASVFQPYSVLDTTTATANPDSYKVLLTCYPHNADGTCPIPSQAVSRSCCDLGAHMTALRAPNDVPHYARGFASMPTFP
jgi:hypothetical protein